jgi:hypothetical protein
MRKSENGSKSTYCIQGILWFTYKIHPLILIWKFMMILLSFKLDFLCNAEGKLLNQNLFWKVFTPAFVDSDQTFNSVNCTEVKLWFDNSIYRLDIILGGSSSAAEIRGRHYCLDLEDICRSKRVWSRNSSAYANDKGKDIIV